MAIAEVTTYNCEIRGNQQASLVMPQFDAETLANPDQFADLLNELTTKAEANWQNISLGNICDICTIASGQIVLDLNRCRNFYVRSTADINSIDLQNLRAGVSFCVMFDNTGSDVFNVTGWPTDTFATPLSLDFNIDPGDKAQLCFVIGIGEQIVLTSFSGGAAPVIILPGTCIITGEVTFTPSGTGATFSQTGSDFTESEGSTGSFDRSVSNETRVDADDDASREGLCLRAASESYNADQFCESRHVTKRARGSSTVGMGVRMSGTRTSFTGYVLVFEIDFQPAGSPGGDRAADVKLYKCVDASTREEEHGSDQNDSRAGWTLLINSFDTIEVGDSLVRWRVSVCGSDITIDKDGVEVQTVTDSEITSGVPGMIGSNNGNVLASPNGHTMGIDSVEWVFGGVA